MNSYRMLALAMALLALPMSSYADDWNDESGKRKGKERREFKEEYWDGRCKVERKMEKNGDFKEERKCQAPRHVAYREREEFKEEYRDGNCKVERKMEKNGDFKEERKCKAPRHVDYREREEYVPVPAPVYRTREPEISVDVRIRP